MRKKMVAGNWKMNASRHETRALLETIKKGAAQCSSIDIAVFPSLVHLQQTEEILADSLVAWGAQNMYLEKAGAFTGEVSGPMLIDYGCRYVLVGHSERRKLFYEDVTLVAAKFKTAQQFGLSPLLCVGETLQEREEDRAENIIEQQLASVIEAVSIGAFRDAIIAYEPVWAIGTGLTAKPEQAQETHAFIRQVLADYHPEVAQAVRLLYGGSVKPDNASGLFLMPDIDGVLVGAASLDAKAFLAICQAAM